MPNVWSPLALRPQSQDRTGGHCKKCLGWTCGGLCSCILNWIISLQGTMNQSKCPSTVLFVDMQVHRCYLPFIIPGHTVIACAFFFQWKTPFNFLIVGIFFHRLKESSADVEAPGSYVLKARHATHQSKAARAWIQTGLSSRQCMA